MSISGSTDYGIKRLSIYNYYVYGCLDSDKLGFVMFNLTDQSNVSHYFAEDSSFTGVSCLAVFFN